MRALIICLFCLLTTFSQVAFSESSDVAFVYLESNMHRFSTLKKVKRNIQNKLTNKFEDLEFKNQLKTFFQKMSAIELISLANQISLLEQENQQYFILSITYDAEDYRKHLHKLLDINDQENFKTIDKKKYIFHEANWRITLNQTPQKKNLRKMITAMEDHPKKTVEIFNNYLQNEIQNRKDDILQTIFDINEEIFAFQMKFNKEHKNQELVTNLIAEHFTRTKYYKSLK